MRTNIEIDDKLMKQAMKASGAKTKKAVVEEALKMYVRSHDQQRAINSLWGILKDEGWDGAPEGKDKWAEAKERHAKEAKAGRKKAA
jgi:hypothetical protein